MVEVAREKPRIEVYCYQCEKDIEPIFDNEESFCSGCWDKVDVDIIETRVKFDKLNEGIKQKVNIDSRKRMAVDSSCSKGVFFEKVNLKLTPSASSEDRNIKVLLDKLDHLSKIMSIPIEVKHLTKEIFLKLFSKTLIRGRSFKAVLLSVLCLAFRKLGHPKTIKEFIVKGGISKKELGRNISYISKLMGTKKGLVPPKDFLQRYFLKYFKNRPDIHKEGGEILERIVKDKKAIGKGPLSVVIVIIYNLCCKYNIPIQLRSFLKENSVTDITFRCRRNTLKSYFE